MRNIKYRCWDKIFKAFLQFFYIGSDGKVYNAMGGRDITDEVILNQYTGLKDKKGVEIFEGDIIKDFSGSEHERVREVKWYPDTAGFLNTNLEKEKEVIGNIYQNPELLK